MVGVSGFEFYSPQLISWTMDPRKHGVPFTYSAVAGYDLAPLLKITW
jgi:hypothetical protein